MKAAVTLVMMISGLSFVLSSASCTIPNACTTSSAGSAGSAGTSSAGSGGSNCSDTSDSASAGSSGATTCGQLTALQTCFGTFCAADGAGTPFCNCFTKGFDLGAPPDCGCVTLNAAAFCQQAADNGLDGSNLDCSSATGSVATQCVDVQ
jgi:hypothetical protein